VMESSVCRSSARLAALLSAALLTACVSQLPHEPPPLADVEEPLELFAEPDDESARVALPLGCFTGCVAGEARDSLEALLEEGSVAGVAVQQVVENSPADVAGLKPGDLLLEVAIGDGEPHALRTASEWRKAELEVAAGTPLRVAFDRANRRTSTTITPVPRVRAPARQEVRRVREEERIGVVLRTATEVEARGAGLGPGGGAVIVGLSRRSPWRAAGLRFGDLVAAVDGRAVTAPELVLERIREGQEKLVVDFVRDGARSSVATGLTQRAQTTREFSIPVLFSYESERGRRETSVLLGLFGHQRTRAAWRVTILWFIRFGRGDADALLEVRS